MDCPEFLIGCCGKGYCYVPDHQIVINDWEKICIVESVWRRCPYLPANRH